MRKAVKTLVCCLIVTALIWCVGVISDRRQLTQNIIRLHVVANSDEAEDQAVKLRVRDAVTESLRQELQQLTDVEAAKEYLRENLPKLQKIANQTLKEAGFDEQAVVSLCREAFSTRIYDTFTLPAGVYEALRITIGEGNGKNWWCVVFPALCLPATSKEVEDSAVNAGFSEELSGALAGEDGYEIRFFLLDVLGKGENILFKRGI